MPTETPKNTAETKTTAAPATPNPFAAFDPMAAFTASQQAFHKMWSDAFGRAQTVADQYAAIEAQLVARAQTAVQGWAQLAQDAITYSAQLSAEARKIGLENVRRFATVGA